MIWAVRSKNWHKRDACIHRCEKVDATGYDDEDGEVGIEEIYKEPGKEKKEGKM